MCYGPQELEHARLGHRGRKWDWLHSSPFLVTFLGSVCSWGHHSRLAQERSWFPWGVPPPADTVGFHRECAQSPRVLRVVEKQEKKRQG